MALLSLADRLSTPDRRSPIARFSSLERVSIPDRRSFVVRLSAPDRFLMSPIVCLRWLPRIAAPTRYLGLRARDKLPQEGDRFLSKSGSRGARGAVGLRTLQILAALPANWLSFPKQRIWAPFQAQGRCSFKWVLACFDPQRPSWISTVA